MLRSLSVRNFILIDELELEFNKGLCIITGETGAGKSILLDAIMFCLGGGFTNEVIKNGTLTCAVTAVFTANTDAEEYLHGIGIQAESELIIKCIQSCSGRRKFFINDQIVTQKTVKQVSDYLIETHENNHTLLINPSSHVDILDNFGDLLDLRKEIADQFRLWQNIRKDLTAIAKEKEYIEREIDYLTFVTTELQKTNIGIGEEGSLAVIRTSLQNREREVKLVKDLLHCLEIPEIDQSINKAQRLIGRSGKEEIFSSISKAIEEAYNNFEEAKYSLKSLLTSFEDGQYNLEETEERLFKIRELARKYGVHADELPAFLQFSELKLQELQSKINNSHQLEEQLQIVENKYEDLAQILTTQRLHTASILAKKIQQELSYLKMEKAVFQVEITSREDKELSSNGMDLVRFVASTNPGMPVAPIDKIASGGELSRFMLAIRVALFDKASKPTIIFDEIDTGIGGIVADSVGNRLQVLSQAVQVIVITHQLQVACKAMQHIMVKKLQSENQTSIVVTTLIEEEKISELARMISGKYITENSLKAAKELANS